MDISLPRSALKNNKKIHQAKKIVEEKIKKSGEELRLLEITEYNIKKFS